MEYKKEKSSKTFYLFGLPFYKKTIKDFKVSRRFLFFRFVRIDVHGLVKHLLDASRIETLASQLDSYRNELSVLSEQLRKVESLLNDLKGVSANLNKTQSIAAELVWAHIFKDASHNSHWLKDKTFYPGRWAIGYPAMYVLYRVLNEAKPKSILELGLGQSTRMIAQYAKAIPNVHHTVVENNPSWIDFFSADFPLSDATKILKLDWVMKSYKEVQKVRVFDHFKETFTGNKFDLIFIDAPLGGDMKVYSRIDILSILPECLEENFIIMLDDYDRPGEKGTIKEILTCFDANKIAYKAHAYAGEKTIYLICSASLGWFASM